MDDAKANDRLEAGETDRIIAEEVDRLLASPLFTRSPVLTRLLQYLVDHRLRGGRAAPKAYAIATEALGRSADFDPAVDSYPRVMVGRLRTLLDRYYAETAWVHRLRVPQGSYEIVVQNRTAPPARAVLDTGDNGFDAPPAMGADEAFVTPPRHGDKLHPAPRRRRAWIALMMTILVLGVAAWWLAENRDRLFAQRSVPMPLLEISVPLSGDTPQSRALARALDGRLRDGLRRFDLVDLRSARAPANSPPEDRADYRLDVSVVRSFEGPADVTLVLNRVADQRTIWSQRFHFAQNEMPEFVQVDTAIAQIAGDYGVIVRDQVQRQPENYAPGFACLAQFNRMRQMRTAGNALLVGKCLRATLQHNPRDPVTLNALSLLRFGDWQPLRGTPEGAAAHAEARSFAEQAYENGPGTAAGQFAMARANFYAGNCAGGIAMGDTAARFNPYDADIAGFLGLFKLGCDRPAEAAVLLQRSLDLDSSYPGIPAVTLAFMRSQTGDQEAAMAILDRVPSSSAMEPQFLMARSIVLARQGKLAEARALWQQLLKYTKQPANAPAEEVLRQFVITPVVIERSAQALREAGVVPAT